MRNSKLRIESYYNTLPSGDIVSDSELDTFLCEEFFAEEFEFTIMDQSSVGGTTLRFSLTKKQAAQLSGGKDFSKNQKEQVGPRGQKLKKTATFSMGDKLQKVTETEEELSGGGLDFGGNSPAISSKASGEKPESFGKKSGFLAVGERDKVHRSMKNINFMLDENLEQDGFDIPSPGGMSEAGSNFASPFKQHNSISPLGRRSPTRLRKFELIAEPIHEEVADEASEPSIHHSGVMKFQRGYSKESNKVANGLTESGRALGDSDSRDIAERDITSSNPNQDKPQNVVISSFPEIDAQLPIIRPQGIATSGIIPEQDEEEHHHSTPNASVQTQRVSATTGCSPNETQPTNNTRLETLSQISPPARPPPRNSPIPSMEITSSKRISVPVLRSSQSIDSNQQPHTGEVLPELQVIQPKLVSSTAIEDIERKIQQARERTIDLDDQLQKIREESSTQQAQQSASYALHNAVSLDNLNQGLSQSGLELGSKIIGEGELHESEDLIEDSELIEQSSILQTEQGRDAASGPEVEEETDKVEEIEAHSELIEIHGDSFEGKRTQEARRNSTTQAKPILQTVVGPLSLTSSPKLQGISSLRQPRDPRLELLLGSAQSIKIPKGTAPARSGSKAPESSVQKPGSELGSVTAKLMKTTGQLHKPLDIKSFNEKLRFGKQSESTVKQLPKDVQEYGLTSAYSSNRTVSNISKPLSTLLAKTTNAKVLAATQKPQKQSSTRNSPDKKNNLKTVTAASTKNGSSMQIKVSQTTEQTQEHRSNTMITSVLLDRPTDPRGLRDPRTASKDNSLQKGIIQSPKGMLGPGSNQPLKIGAFISTQNSPSINMQPKSILERKTVDMTSIPILSNMINRKSQTGASKLSTSISQSIKATLGPSKLNATVSTTSNKPKTMMDLKKEKLGAIFDKGNSAPSKNPQLH